MRTIAIIAAAGKGKRYQAKIPKQYIRINNKPLLWYTLSVFNASRFVDGIIIAADSKYINYCKRLAKKYCLEKVFSVVEGGATRAHSVYNALKAVPCRAEIVLVHDGARPLVKPRLIEDIVKSAKKYGAVITALRPKNTIKEVSAGSFVEKTHIRENLVEVQTPQAFRYKLLMDCYERFKNRLSIVTDDSSLIEMAGYKVKVVAGDYENIKITTKEDIVSFRNMQNSALYGFRIGAGYDIHRLVKNRRLVLGGVDIPSKYGLLGHSDADVLLHAITDAMLGAVGERDIGWHFSNKDKRYKDMDSSYFLITANEILRKKGYKIRNIDSIIVAQEPKLQPYYTDMTGNISKWLKIRKENVTVKFTTPEEVGPLGHKKAIAGMAVVAVVKG